jgi:ABC-type sulfate/molybdate transport systems ATPase subunit
MVFHKLPVEKRQVGFIFQDQALFLTASVMENVAFGLKVRGVRKGARRKEAEKWLAEAGLGHKVQARVDELSGGERQRVCWLRAMIWKPEILLLDEPFSGLDEGNRAWLEQLVTRKCPTAPLLFSTHHEVEIEQFAHKVLVCEQGSEQGLRISRFS